MWAKTFSNGIIKYINSWWSNKYPGNDAFRAELFKHFSNIKGSVVFFDVDDSWGKLGTMRVTYIGWIISAIYQSSDKKRYCKLQTHILQFLKISCKKY